jgi:hypothetical protein
MNRILKVLGMIFVTVLVSSCVTAEPEPEVLEYVSWAELADKEMMESNDNRYVSVDIQFLGADAKAMPSQMLYGEISKVVLVNHTEVGEPYDEAVITSLDSFLVGLPQGDATDDLMTKSQFGDTITVIGRTEFIKAGFGTFQHLMVRVESFENMGQ